jgi:integral membrane protein (TIGR01906 family)
VRILLSLATAITILAAALVLLLTPVWTHFALRAAGSTTVGGVDQVTRASDETVLDLLTLGDFEITAADGTALYTDDERGHMRDVQVVLYLFVGLAAAAALFVAFIVSSGPQASEWAAVARGGAGVVIGVVVLGVMGALAFGVAFELFHKIFFPGGNWAFPPDSNLIRLYPLPFWQLSSAALGGLAAAGGAVTWWFARRRAARVPPR